MAHISKTELIEAVTAITVAKIANSSYKPDEVVDFMDKVADELIAISKKVEN